MQIGFGRYAGGEPVKDMWYKGLGRIAYDLGCDPLNLGQVGLIVGVKDVG